MEFKPLLIDDLRRGEGEWRNIQLCTRKAFSEHIEIMQRQQEQIGSLTSAVEQLRVQIGQKLEKDDVIDIMTHKLKSEHKYAKKKELDSLFQTVSDLSADLERKPSRSYVDDGLRKKVDKSESMAVFLKTSKDMQMPLASEIAELKGRTTILASQLSNIAESSKQFAKSDDVIYLRSQIDHMFSINAELPSREFINHVLEEKTCRSEVDTLLYNKVDKPTLSAALTRIEETLGEHERLLTTLRLRDDADELMDSAAISKGNLLPLASRLWASQVPGSDAGSASVPPKFSTPARMSSKSPIRGRLHNATKSSAAKSRDDVEKQKDPSGDAWSSAATDGSSGVLRATQKETCCDLCGHGLQQGRLCSCMKACDSITDQVAASRAAGRLDAMITAVWKRMNSFQNTSTANQSTIAQLLSRVKDIELLTDRSASAEKVETLAVILEEQRMRTDSIILGSVKIEPVDRAVQRIETRLNDIELFLQLPQHRNLADMLQELKFDYHSLKSQVAEMISNVGRASLRSDTVAASISEFDSRLRTIEDMPDRIQRLSTTVGDIDGRMMVAECTVASMDQIRSQIEEIKIEIARHKYEAASLSATKENFAFQATEITALQRKISDLASTVAAAETTANTAAMEVNEIMAIQQESQQQQQIHHRELQEIQQSRLQQSYSVGSTRKEKRTYSGYPTESHDSNSVESRSEDQENREQSNYHHNSSSKFRDHREKVDSRYLRSSHRGEVSARMPSKHRDDGSYNRRQSEEAVKSDELSDIVDASVAVLADFVARHSHSTSAKHTQLRHGNVVSNEFVSGAGLLPTANILNQSESLSSGALPANEAIINNSSILNICSVVDTSVRDSTTGSKLLVGPISPVSSLGSAADDSSLMLENRQAISQLVGQQHSRSTAAASSTFAYNYSAKQPTRSHGETLRSAPLEPPSRSSSETSSTSSSSSPSSRDEFQGEDYSRQVQSQHNAQHTKYVRESQESSARHSTGYSIHRSSRLQSEESREKKDIGYGRHKEDEFVLNSGAIDARLRVLQQEKQKIQGLLQRKQD